MHKKTIQLPAHRKAVHMLTGLFLCCTFFPHGAYSQESRQLFKLWLHDTFPAQNDIPLLKNVVFKSIKKYEPAKDGYRFLHGVAIVNDKGKWIVSFGHNKGDENTGSEEANSMISFNDGKSWSGLIPMDNPPGDLATSHGVFLNYRDTIWSFNGAFTGSMEHVHTRAFFWNEQESKWIFKGVVARSGFWPLQEPVHMDNGHWIMAGAVIEENNTPPAVAICTDNTLMNWEVKKIPVSYKVWGESAIIANGANILLIARSGANTPKFHTSHPLAWVSESHNFGNTWSELQPSNMPMAASKPYAGILSNGQRYLISSSASDAGNRRSPLTIAVSRPNEDQFSKIFCIRRSVVSQPSVESNANVALAYPYAVEYKEHLWVVYSNNGGDVGRTGQGRALWNNNSAELAIIPIADLSFE